MTYNKVETYVTGLRRLEDDPIKDHNFLEAYDANAGSRPQRNIWTTSRFDDYESFFAEVEIPEIYEEAIESKNCKKEQLGALKGNSTLEETICLQIKNKLILNGYLEIKKSLCQYVKLLCDKGYCQTENIRPNSNSFDISHGINYKIIQFDSILVWRS